MSGKQKSTWGGARAGAGRPKQSISIRQLNAMLRKARKWAKQTGYDVDEFLLAVIGANKKLLGIDEVPLRERITCVKIWKDFTMSKVSEQNINVNQDTETGPAIYRVNDRGEKVLIRGRGPICLPEQRPDSALEVINGGKKNE